MAVSSPHRICYLMCDARGRQTYQLTASATVTVQPDATADILTRIALHTQAQFPSSCSGMIPRDCVTEFILSHTCMSVDPADVFLALQLNTSATLYIMNTHISCKTAKKTALASFQPHR